MKLYTIPKGSKIRAESYNEEGEKIGDILTFHNLDGMYSVCTVDGVTEEYNIAHLSVNQELTLGEDGIYDLTPSPEPNQ